MAQVGTKIEIKHIIYFKKQTGSQVIQGTDT